MNRFRFLLTLFLLPVTLLACSDDNSPTLDPEDYVGSYSLYTMNGSELPGTIEVNGLPPIEVESAIASLKHDTEWGVIFVGKIGGGATQTLPFSGTYSISGNKLTLRVVEDEQVVNTLKGSIQVEAETLTIDYEGTILVFKMGVPV